MLTSNGDNIRKILWLYSLIHYTLLPGIPFYVFIFLLLNIAKVVNIPFSPYTKDMNVLCITLSVLEYSELV